ncbi:peptidoglycan-binding domain-containing protein [uncultured Hyphomonas sp.]|uniref:peptidoglycan-binding domain-containing protein n=1 Tax=uncultured Hyphomonas sp. TaxID=225298 RepID=UPI002AABC864|nr:peptidoglycan-binding domain-containing protein [uncultured Hyphomonas sp.]
MSRILTLSAASLVLAGAAAAQGTGDYPADAAPGACYARVLIPETYEIQTEQVLDKPEHTEARVIPATFETVLERVMVKEQAMTYRVVPPVYEIETEQLVVMPEQTETVVIPAEYETFTEQVLVRPSYITWKPGEGLFGRAPSGEENVTLATGEVLCRVEVPAQYDTVTRTRLKSPEQVETRVIPARFRTVERQVLREPARIVEELVPAEYEDVEVQRLVTPEQQETIVVPATYKTIEKRTVTGGGTVEWREVLCDSNATEARIAEVQRALAGKGYDVQPDGVFGPATLNAMEDWQQKNGLPVGYLTIGTVESLGVSPD